jgi:hypothetical protein
MEPHLQRRYSESAIDSYTNERSVPPGDVLLAAALAVGISLDEKLGIVRHRTETGREIDELRAEMDELRSVVAGLQDRLTGERGASTDLASIESGRRARRREWARGRSPSQGMPEQLGVGAERRQHVQDTRANNALLRFPADARDSLPETACSVNTLPVERQRILRGWTPAQFGTGCPHGPENGAQPRGRPAKAESGSRSGSVQYVGVAAVRCDCVQGRSWWTLGVQRSQVEPVNAMPGHVKEAPRADQPRDTSNPRRLSVVS